MLSFEMSSFMFAYQTIVCNVYFYGGWKCGGTDFFSKLKKPSTLLYV